MMERFVIIVNGFQSLTIITKRSILDVAALNTTKIEFELDTIQKNIKSMIFSY